MKRKINLRTIPNSNRSNGIDFVYCQKLLIDGNFMELDAGKGIMTYPFVSD
jgi:hypothetical protein